MGQSKKKDQKRTEITKDTLLKHLEQNMGNVTLACHFGKCSRSTFYRYYNADDEFKKAVDDITEIAIDICESELWKQIKDGNVPCILFYLNRRHRHKRYFIRRGCGWRKINVGRILGFKTMFEISEHALCDWTITFKKFKGNNVAIIV